MKKFLIVLICLNLVLPSFAFINDEFVESSLDKNLEIRRAPQVFINDNLVQENLDSSLQVKPINPVIINDAFAESNPNKSKISKKNVIIEESIPVINKESVVRKKYIAEDTNEKRVAILVKSDNAISTKSQPEEGDTVYFKTTHPVVINGKTYPVGTVVKGRIETVSMNFSFGVPADIVIGSFSIDGKPLDGEIKKIGANRSLWVKPCSYVGCFLFGLGVLIMPIRGGHAKIRQGEVITVYYR